MAATPSTLPTPAIPGWGSGGSKSMIVRPAKCAACGKGVYPLERVQACGKDYHKQCFRCKHCDGVLSLKAFATINNDPYCKPHYMELFKSKGNYAVFGDTDAKGGTGYTGGFFVAISPTTAAKTPEKPSPAASPAASPAKPKPQLSNSGPSAAPTITTTAPSPISTSAPPTPAAAAPTPAATPPPAAAAPATVPAVAQLQAPVSQVAPDSPGTKLRRAVEMVEHSGEIRLKSQAEKAEKLTKATEEAKKLPTPAIPGWGTGGSKSMVSRPASCAACGKGVYPLERVQACGKDYHKGCFRCKHCDGVLSLKAFATINNDPYCKPHYLELFKNKGNYAGFGDAEAKGGSTYTGGFAGVAAVAQGKTPEPIKRTAASPASASPAAARPEASAEDAAAKKKAEEEAAAAKKAADEEAKKKAADDAAAKKAADEEAKKKAADDAAAKKKADDEAAAAKKAADEEAKKKAADDAAAKKAAEDAAKKPSTSAAPAPAAANKQAEEEAKKKAAEDEAKKKAAADAAAAKKKADDEAAAAKKKADDEAAAAKKAADEEAKKKAADDAAAKKKADDEAAAAKKAAEEEAKKKAAAPSTSTASPVPTTPSSLPTPAIPGWGTGGSKSMIVRPASCAACGKGVYPLERVQACGKDYHKQCFRCKHCNMVLSLKAFATINNDPYCKPHYMELFKSKGNYAVFGDSDAKGGTGYTGGMFVGVGTSAGASSPAKAPASPAPTKAAESPAPSPAVEKKEEPKPTPAPAVTSTPTPAPASTTPTTPLKTSTGQTSAPAASPSTPTRTAPAASLVPTTPSSLPTPAIPGWGTGGSKSMIVRPTSCAACGKGVYPLERVQACDKDWHKQCFRCKHCNMVLSLKAFATINNDPYCKPHYMELFKSKGNYAGFGDSSAKGGTAYTGSFAGVAAVSKMGGK